MIQKVPDIRVVTGERIDAPALSRVLHHNRTALNAVIGTPILGGNIIERVTLNDGSPTVVAHRLGRKPLGWFLLRTRYLGAEVYDSGEHAITSGGALSLTHGLGAAPLLVQPHLVCKTAEDGYAVGDIVYPFFGQVSVADASTIERGVAIKASSTALTARFGTATTVFQVQHATTGAAVALTNSNWRLVVRAMRERRLIDQQAAESTPERFLRLLGSGFADGETVDLMVL